MAAAVALQDQADRLAWLATRTASSSRNVLGSISSQMLRGARTSNPARHMITNTEFGTWAHGSYKYLGRLDPLADQILSLDV